MPMWVMSGRAIPRSFRFMEGFGVHTFRLVNAAGKPAFVKFGWKPKQGLQSVLWNEAVKVNGADPDFHRRDLRDAIGRGDLPEWELGLQLFDEEFADRFGFDVLDPARIIPEEEVPIRRVGRLVLDRVLDNVFAETEQVAFCTQNTVPGIDFSDDPLLRSGSPNFTQLPVNAPRCPFATFQQDGHMAAVNPVTRANYEPNSWAAEGGPREDPAAGFTTYPDGQTAGPRRRLRAESFADHYSQARQFFISQTEVEQQHVIDAFVFELSKCERPDIRQRIVAGLRNVHEDLASAVAAGLGLDGLPERLPAASEPVTDLTASPPLSILANGPDSFAGRKIGVLVTDGIDAEAVEHLRTTADENHVTVELIAPAVGGIDAANGTRVPAGQQIAGGPSVLYDAVIVLAAKDGARALASMPAAREFITDAYAHRKFIGYTEDAMPLFQACGVDSRLDDGFIAMDQTTPAQFITSCAKLRFWERQP
jgi:catalase